MKVPALNWGITNEPIACKAYADRMQAVHDDFVYECAGLFINPAFPHLGASPNGLVSCRCCGAGLVEIKCPYTHRLLNPSKIVDDKFYLQ